MSMPGTTSSSLALRLGVAACVAALALHAYTIARPMLYFDDFVILRQSYTWQSAWDGLWLPQNEHTMPLGRLSTWALIQLAGRPSALPLVAALQGPLAVVAGMGLLYRFVRRELGHPFYGLAAMAVFGITGVYQQAVSWFAASFSVLTLDTLLLALLAAQSWRQCRRWHHLVLSALWCALAPGWFASGVLAGPVCCLYLFRRDGDQRSGIRHLIPDPRSLIPLLGTVAFLAVSLPHTREHIQHLPHYGDKTAVQAFDPLVGLWYTGAGVVENLALGLFGITGVSCPIVLLPVALALLIAGGAWWWQPVAERRLALLGLGLIVLGYLLAYGARAQWIISGEPMNAPNWSRYNLLPQLGLVLLLTGGLPRWQGNRLALDSSGRLSLGQARALLLLVAILFVVQLPRTLIVAVWRYDPAQGEALRQIAVLDKRCRANGIAAETARTVLPPIHVFGAGENENGWWMLRGSPDPRPLPLDEARRLLSVEP
jgi:hypothetical protein